MTTNKRKKVVKYRGSKTHGGGAMKKRRGAGNRGGRGAAGSGKRSDAKKPSIWNGKYFGKYGFKSKSRSLVHSVNIDYIDRNINKFVFNKKATQEKDFFSIDLEVLGFNKLLGNGKVSNKYKIKTSYASKRAIEKIKTSGGEVILQIKQSEK